VAGVGAGLYIKFKSIPGGPTLTGGKLRLTYLGGPTQEEPEKFSGRAHPLETLLNLRARALRALEALLKKPASRA